MDKLLNKVLYGSSGPQGSSSNNGSQTLTVRPHPEDDNLLFIVPAGASKQAPPLYAIYKRPSSCSLILHRGPPAPETQIGMAKMHVSSSKIDLSLFNQQMLIKNNSMSGSWSFQTHIGKFKWKPNELTGTGFYLHDPNGTKVAKYGSAGMARFGEKTMSIYVQGDEWFMTMVLLSAVAAKELGKIINEVVGEVIGAVAGA
ncbi:hypothetical protein F53441_11673 [Fusarium austroafricanum]|uniref:Uncharacterized protein n=1 Tax=Fusarium austroafricanum TaxID=2364996 RepID=A0A8H4K2Y4_9HYPO|nr:hypothetical protein F53441_11673 [Fusarium austroafricanum]